MDKDKIRLGMQHIIEGLGDNPDREGLRRTSERFTTMCGEIFAGYEMEAPELSVFESPSAQSVVIIRDIPFYSMCEHHFLPFFGEMQMAYVPGGQRVVGFSDIVQVVRHFSHRLQIQERLTRQIAEYISQHLQPEGLMLISSATQLCMSMRGVKSQNARTEVISYLGKFESDSALRQEAMNILKK